MGKATVLKVDGTREELDHRPTLEEAQKIVGGYIEYIRLDPNNLLVVDEDGKPKGLPTNKQATLLYQWGKVVGDVIHLEGWKGVAGD